MNEQTQTYYNLITNKIANLIVKRAKAKDNKPEQQRINEKLTKLYNIKYTILKQNYNK